MKDFKPGIYKHFKGGLYKTLFVARDSENPEEEFIVYKSLENEQVWVRPAKMFFEEIRKEKYKGPRFTQINEKET